MPRKFAKHTYVPVEQSRGQIRAIIGAYGGLLLDERDDVPGRTIIMFRSNHTTPRHLRVMLQWPVNNVPEEQRKWRSLFLDIKAKFVAVDDGIETFDQVFMAWIIGENGLTIYEMAQELRLLPPAA